jgi:hypothetical protein
VVNKRKVIAFSRITSLEAAAEPARDMPSNAPDRPKAHWIRKFRRRLSSEALIAFASGLKN